jgi:hypothetical protein
MNSLLLIEILFHKSVRGNKKCTRRALSKSVLKHIPPNYDPLKFLNSYRGKQLARYKLYEVVYLAESWKITPGVLDDEIYFELKFSKTKISNSIMYGNNYAYKVRNLMKFWKLQNKSKTGWINKMFVPTWLREHFPVKAKITGVRAEYLQDITEDECKSEGCSHIGTDKWVNPLSEKIFETGIDSFKSLIETQGIGKKGDWDRNPLVWVYDYEVINE